MAKPNMLITAMRGKFLACLLLPLTMFLGCTHQDEPSQQISRPVKVARIVDQSRQCDEFRRGSTSAI